MILAQFRPVSAVNHPYTVNTAQRNSAKKEMVQAMVFTSHVIENDNISPIKGRRAKRLRRLILLGLAVAMAFATLAPMVVLAA